jgi:predicted nucleic acid-binding protein
MARAGQLQEEEVLGALRIAQHMPVKSRPVLSLWWGAALRAFARSCSPYDTLFVELAVRLGCPLATYD